MNFKTKSTIAWSVITILSITFSYSQIRNFQIKKISGYFIEKGLVECKFRGDSICAKDFHFIYCEDIDTTRLIDPCYFDELLVGNPIIFLPYRFSGLKDNSAKQMFDVENLEISATVIQVLQSENPNQSFGFEHIYYGWMFAIETDLLPGIGIRQCGFGRFDQIKESEIRFNPNKSWAMIPQLGFKLKNTDLK